MKCLANKKGFTLIELIIVILILGILAAIAFPAVSGYATAARQATADANAKTVYNAAVAAAALHGYKGSARFRGTTPVGGYTFTHSTNGGKESEFLPTLVSIVGTKVIHQNLYIYYKAGGAVDYVYNQWKGVIGTYPVGTYPVP